jgi:hypothetical protein
MRRARLLIAIVSLLGLAACASMAEDMLAGYQCEREAANRPDQVQREAECQNELQTSATRQP